MVPYFKNNIQSLNWTCSHHWNAMEPVADRLTPFITNYQIKPKISAFSVRLKQKFKCKFKLNNALIIPNAIHVKTLHYSVPFIVFVLNLKVSTEFSHTYTIADKPKQNSLKCAFLPFVLQPPPWIFALSIRKIHRPGFPTLVFLGMSITWWVRDPGMLKNLIPSPALKPACQRKKVGTLTQTYLRNIFWLWFVVNALPMNGQI